MFPGLNLLVRPVSADLNHRFHGLLFVLLGVGFRDGCTVVAQDGAGGFEADPPSFQPAGTSADRAPLATRGVVAGPSSPSLCRAGLVGAPAMGWRAVLKNATICSALRPAEARIRERNNGGTAGRASARTGKEQARNGLSGHCRNTLKKPKKNQA